MAIDEVMNDLQMPWKQDPQPGGDMISRQELKKRIAKLTQEDVFRVEPSGHAAFEWTKHDIYKMVDDAPSVPRIELTEENARKLARIANDRCVSEAKAMNLLVQWEYKLMYGDEDD